jgi:beta-glucosidase
LGIEWSRLELAEGEYDQAAIEHYKRELAELKQQGTKIVLTLWHWTIPLWLVKKGGWSNRSAVDYFERFAELAVKEFGEYVDFWVILNEPMVHVANGYLKAKFPPAKKNPLLAYKALKNLILAQKVAHRVIHEKLPTASVGFTVLANYIEAKDKNNFFDVKLAKIFDYWWNLYFVRKVDGFFDFLGLDYYFHDKISFKPPFLANDGQDLTDFGWEIYPEGIYEVLKHFADFKKPLYIMENGLADATDAKRADFIKKHLFFVHKAIGEGVDVRGYFHWSLIDNFEWADGFWPQFGLYMINRQTFERTPRPSAAVYAKICQDNGFWLD